MLDVGQEQFLMLLLMMKSQCHKICDLSPARTDQPLHGGVNIGTIFHHLVVRGPAQKSALRARMARSQSLVIGIEQIGEGRIERRIIIGILRKDDSFEKPCRVREMPFRRARIRHRLHGAIFRA